MALHRQKYREICLVSQQRTTALLFILAISLFGVWVESLLAVTPAETGGERFLPFNVSTAQHHEADHQAPL